MKSEQIEQAAKLLEKRREMQELRSFLIAKPSFVLGLYASDREGTMHHDFHISNELGRGLLNIAIDANSQALAEAGVDEFAGHQNSPTIGETP